MIEICPGRLQAQRLVHLKISTRTMKTLEKKGLQAMADEAVSHPTVCHCPLSSSLPPLSARDSCPRARSWQGINLWDLPYTDMSENRKKYLAENSMSVPVAKNPRKMNNPEKLAASKKKPMEARYVDGRVVWVRSSM